MQPDVPLSAFLVMWSAMMTAMMLPSMAPVAARYVRRLQGGRGRRQVRGTLFVGGYLLVWAGSGVGAHGLVRLADLVVARGGLAPQLFAAGVLGAGALYYLTPLKLRFLGLCRSPLGLLLRYAGYRGRLRDLRAGVHHGLTCLGCCWSLMALMVVFGMMNVVAMVVLGLVVALEKLWARGEGVARTVGMVTAMLAVAVLAVPELAVGLTARGMS